MKFVRLAMALLLILAATDAISDTSTPAAPVAVPVKAAAAKDSANKGSANKAMPVAKLKALVEQRLGGDTKVETLTKTPYDGLYEIRTSRGDILYTDNRAKYLMAGHIVDLETHKDYTKQRMDEVNKIAFSDLPFSSAIKMVKGNGKRQIAVFEDPNCGYCKRLRHTLAGMDNVTVYTFMYNILAPDSFVKSKNVWCTDDRVKAWDDWMLNGKEPVEASASCASTPNDAILELGKKLRITGTPTIIFADGSRVPGALDAPALEEKWATIQ